MAKGARKMYECQLLKSNKIGAALMATCVLPPVAYIGSGHIKAGLTRLNLLCGSPWPNKQWRLMTCARFAHYCL